MGMMSPRLWLASGIAAPVLCAAADVVAGMRWDDYSFRDQTISELGAIGAPTRLLFSVALKGLPARCTSSRGWWR
jgi:hypothetical protein